MYVSNQIVSMYSSNSNFINSRGMERRNTRVKIKTKITELPTSPFGQRIYELTRKIENYRLQIFWLTLYILVTLGIFLERAFCEYTQNCFKSQWEIKEIQTQIDFTRKLIITPQKRKWIFYIMLVLKPFIWCTPTPTSALVIKSNSAITL